MTRGKRHEAELEALRAEFATHRTALANMIWKRDEGDDEIARLREEVQGYVAKVATFEAQFIAAKKARHVYERSQAELEGHVETCRQAAAATAIAQAKLDQLDAVLNESVAARDTVLALSTDSRLVALLAERG